MSNETKGNPLGTKPILPLLMQYAIPSIISMLVTSIYNIVDQLYISWDVGNVGNGATTVAFPIITVGLAFALLVGNGSAAFISINLGSGNKEDAQKSLGQAVVLCVVSSVVLMALGLLFLEPLLKMLGGSEVMDYARDYTSVILLGFPLNSLGVCLSNIIRADGSPRHSMFCVLVGAVLNVILDPIFIFVFGMEVKGAAIATVISQGASMLVVLYYFWKRGKILRFQNTSYRLIPPMARRICALGSASFITQMAIAIVNTVLNISLTYYGAQTVYGSVKALSAMGIVMKINAIVISVVLGFVIGAQPLLGYNYGAGNYSRVRRTYFTEISFTFAIGAIACLVFVTMPQVIISILRDPDPLFNEFAAKSMRTYLCCLFTVGIQIPSANYFQAVGKPLKAMTLSMSRQILLLVPAILILPLFFGLDGVLYAAPVADVGALLITSFFIIREMRHLGKAVVIQETEISLKGGAQNAS